MGVDGPGEVLVTESSALPDTMREGDGSGLTLVVGTDPRFINVIWFWPILKEVSPSADSTVVMAAAAGVCDSSSVGCVASFR